MLAGLTSLASSAHYEWKSYHNNTELYAEYDKLKSSCSALKLQHEGKTKDGWDLLTANYGSKSEDATKIMFIFGIHGREYLGAEIGLALMKKLCETDDSRITSLLSKANFKFFPLMNPSGRAGNLPESKTAEHDEECELRRTNSNGVDLNRNFNEAWNSFDGNSATIGAVDYRGPSAESEIETKALIRTGTEFKPMLYVDVHTGAFTQLTPYSCNTTKMNDVTYNRQVGLVEHVQRGQKEPFVNAKPTYGQGSLLLYVATGTTMDFFYNTLGTPYAYTWETFDAAVSPFEFGDGRTAAGAVMLDAEERWVPDMPQMRAYVERTRAERFSARRNVTLADASRRQPAGAVNALQPDGIWGEAAVSSNMPLAGRHQKLKDDSCFTFYNPNYADELEAYVNSWLEYLLKASEYVVENPAPLEQR